MIPKIIHLCWFSNEPYPVEVKICLDSWARILPDYRIRLWTYADAQAIGCRFIDEALSVRKWAFASDAVRFYAIYKEGGIYMDSDMLLKKPFTDYIPEKGFVSFNEYYGGDKPILLQAAFLMGEAGNPYCKEVFDYYNGRPFILQDGSYDMTISPQIMVEIAKRKGYLQEEKEQHLMDDIVIYPGRLVSPSKKVSYPEAFAQHQVYGSWRKHKLGRKIERFLKHAYLSVRYFVCRR